MKMHLGLLLKPEREARKLSVGELAAMMGKPAHSLKAWEEGERHPRLGSAIVWAKALGFELKLEPVK